MATLEEADHTASEVAVEGFDGWGQAMSTRHDWSEVTEGLGTRYEIALNTDKPFAAGIVSHPAIDAAIQLRDVDRMTVTLKDGRVLHRFVEHALGNQANPMTDAQLEGKFTDLSDGILSSDRTKRLIDLCWGAWDLPDVGEIGRAGAAAA